MYIVSTPTVDIISQSFQKWADGTKHFPFCVITFLLSVFQNVVMTELNNFYRHSLLGSIVWVTTVIAYSLGVQSLIKEDDWSSK
jgi:hypothetical protein